VVDNLRVADHRTYFVGDDTWSFAVWAHNLDCVDFVNVTPTLPPGQRAKLAERGETILAELTTNYPSLNIRGLVETQLLRDGGKYYDSAPSLVRLLDKIKTELAQNQRGTYNVLAEAAKRVVTGHRVAIEISASVPSHRADLIDHTVREAIQMKTITSKNSNILYNHLRFAIDQLFGRHNEHPPANYNLIAWLKIAAVCNPYASFTTPQQFAEALSRDWKFRQSSRIFDGIDRATRNLLIMRFELPNGTKVDLRYSDLSDLPQD
jgi:hypothetical protein